MEAFSLLLRSPHRASVSLPSSAGGLRTVPFIMSGIGLNESIPENIGAKRIIIENERYHLLQKEDYNAYKDLLEILCEIE